MNPHDVGRLRTLCKRGFDARIYGHEERVMAVCSSAVESQSVEKVALYLQRGCSLVAAGR